MELNKKAAYLQGLVDGLGVDESTKEGKIIKAMAALLGEMADAIAAMDEDLTRAYDQRSERGAGESSSRPVRGRGCRGRGRRRSRRG